MSTTGVDAAAARTAEVLRELQELPAVAQALAGAPHAVLESLPRVLAASDFIAESCVRDPGVIPALLAGALHSRRSAADFAAIAAAEGTHTDEATFQAWIRRWRRRDDSLDDWPLDADVRGLHRRVVLAAN